MLMAFTVLVLDLYGIPLDALSRTSEAFLCKFALDLCQLDPEQLQECQVCCSLLWR